MRRLLLVLAVTALAPGGAGAQVRWTPEIGIQGGIARLKPTGTGTSDQIDLWDLPGDGSSYASLFAIIPVTGRLALKPSLSAVQFSLGEAGGLVPFVAGTSLNLTVRGDVALGSGLYAAAGGNVLYGESGGEHDTQIGIVAAAGYRMPVGAGLTARLEAQGTAMRATDLSPPFNVYALLVGISAGARAGVERREQTRVTAQRWPLALGVAGGYVRTHLSGSIGFPIVVDQTLIALPGSGSTIPATLYAIVPLGGRFALEAGLDAHRTQSNGTTFFDGHFSTRVDVALKGGWYAAGGGNVRYVEQTGTAGFAFAGTNVAIGYRFPLIAELGGRVELNYTIFKERENFPLAQNSVGVMFGVTMPIQ
ncbi:MAG: hypothetical protein ACREMC_02830 [Gemmatimonadales bacterium]